MVSVDHDIDRIVLIIGLLQVLDERIVRLQTCLLRLLLVKIDDVTFDKFCEVSHILLLTIHLLLLLILLIVHRLLVNFNHL